MPTRSGKGPPRGAHKYGRPPRTRENDKFNNYKVCSQCGELKRLADFGLSNNWRYKRAADPTKYKAACKACTAYASATVADPNFKPDRRGAYRPPRTSSAEKKRADNARNKRRARRRARIKSIQYLASKGCCDCGERDPRVLEYDHRDPEQKEYNIAKLLADGLSWASEKLRTEIRKCRVICANCHRKHTIDQQGYYGHDDVQAALQEIYGRYDIAE